MLLRTLKIKVEVIATDAVIGGLFECIVWKNGFLFSCEGKCCTLEALPGRSASRMDGWLVGSLSWLSLSLS